MPHPSRRRFFHRAAIQALAIQILPILICAHALRALRLPPWTILVPLLLLLNSALPLYLRHLVPERPLPLLLRRGILRPFFAWLLMCLALQLPGAVMGFIELAAFLTAPSAPASLGPAGPMSTPSAMGTAAVGLVSAALLIGLHGTYVRPRWVVQRRIELPLEGLPPGWRGARIVHLSDLHIGNFQPPEWINKQIDKVNRLDADLILITGDLINSGTHYIDAAAAALGRLSAGHGVYISLGNHDYWGDIDRLIDALERRGLHVLRNDARRIIRRGDALAIAAVDDTWSGRADLDRTMRKTSGRPFILLSHDPMLFPKALERGIPLTLSGHTHGGQLAMPFIPAFNISARTYPYSSGLYQEGTCRIYVNRGLGTTGPAIRIGAAPEIVCITLADPDESASLAASPARSIAAPGASPDPPGSTPRRGHRTGDQQP